MPFLKRIRSDKLGLWLIAIPMALIALSTFYPILFILNIAMKSRRDYVLDRFAIVDTINFDNFTQVWDSTPIATYFMNSIITSGGAVLLLLFLSSLAGYAFSHMKFHGRRVLFFFCITGLMIPVQVIMVPFLQLMIDLNLLNTHSGLIISFVVFFLPFSLYLMTSFYASVPREILEAAKLDGASLWQIYWKIMLPIGKPALISIGILDLLFTWNDILLPLLIMQDRDKRTLMVGISTLRGEFTSNIPLFAAGVIMAILPLLIVYLIFQRQIANGVTVGAVKG